MADFLLGYPSTGEGAQGISIGAFRETDAAAYIQDNWKISKKLTLNLGLRYETMSRPPTSGARPVSMTFQPIRTTSVPGRRTT